MHAGQTQPSPRTNMNPVPATRDDFREWLTMRQALYSGCEETFHLQEMHAILTSREMACFLAKSEVGDSVIGMIELSLRNIVDGCLGSPVGYIEGLYIKPEFRGRGFGRQFVTFADSWFISAGCREMATDTEFDNEDAQRFFRSLDFDETWRIVEFRKRLDL